VHGVCAGEIYPDIFRNAGLLQLDFSDNDLVGFIPDTLRFLPRRAVVLNDNLFWY